MTDFKKHQRKIRKKQYTEDLFFRCIAKGFVEWAITEEGKEYLRITDKGMESVDYDALKFKDLARAFLKQNPESAKREGEINIQERRNKHAEN